MNKPVISVVLSTFNRAERLKRAMVSILAQSFTDFELIVVDDASVDETEEVVKDFMQKDERVKYIKRDINFGTHTRPKNDGTKAATCDLIAYFDDDNVMLPDHLAVLYKYQKDSNADVVYGQSIMIDESMRNAPMIAISSDINNPQGINIFQQNFIDTNQVLVKKRAIEAIGGWDESLPRFADWNLFVRLKKVNASFLAVPLVITEYHVHDKMNQGRFPKFMFDTMGCKIWPDKTLYGPRPKVKVALFTLTMDRLEYTKESFKALKEKTKYPFDHYVIDNGSTDGTVEWLKENEKDFKKVIFNEKNVGISKGSNQALDAMRGENYDLIIKVDNDCKIWSDGWLEVMVDLYERNPRLVLSPVVEGLVDNPGGVPRQGGYVRIAHLLLGLVPHIGGIFCVAPRSAYDQFRWKEDDFLHSDQDWQFSQYCRQRGYMLAYVENLRCEHIESTAGQRERFKDYFKRRDEVEKVTRYKGEKNA